MAQNNQKIASNATGPARPSASVRRIRAADPPPLPPTAPDGRRYCSIPYEECHHYFDTAHFISKRLIAAEDRWWLEEHCDRIDILWDGQLFFDKRRKSWREICVYYPHRFRIEIQVPDDEARVFLARLCLTGDFKLVTAHPARDFNFDHRRNDKGDMHDLFNEHWVQPHQRKDRSAVRFDNGSNDNGGGSTGRRGKGHFFTHYASEHCRIDGIVECFHIEGRYLGKQALAKIGIDTASDLINFDHEALWRKADQACLKEIDVQRLGQYHSNRRRGSRQRQSDRHRRIGGLLIRKYGLDQFGNICVQQFIQRYGRGPFLRNACVAELSNEKMQMSGIDIEVKP